MYSRLNMCPELMYIHIPGLCHIKVVDFIKWQMIPVIKNGNAENRTEAEAKDRIEPEAEVLHCTIYLYCCSA